MSSHWHDYKLLIIHANLFPFYYLINLQVEYISTIEQNLVDGDFQQEFETLGHPYEFVKEQSISFDTSESLYSTHYPFFQVQFLPVVILKQPSLLAS